MIHGTTTHTCDCIRGTLLKKSLARGVSLSKCTVVARAGTAKKMSVTRKKLRAAALVRGANGNSEECS